MEAIKKLKGNFVVLRAISVVFAVLFSLVFSITGASAACDGAANGIIDPGEECEGALFPGGATTCADVGDTTASSSNSLVCTASCTIDWSVTGSNCAGGFIAPDKPGNVPEDFDTAVMNATNWLLGFVAMIGVLAIVWGGINYIASAGNEETAKTAKKTITYGLMGVVIAGFAYAIVKVIVSTILT